MKAIRSLEQHVDSLMSYDFTAIWTEEGLLRTAGGCGRPQDLGDRGSQFVRRIP